MLMRFSLAVAAQEGNAYPLGALPVGTLINNVESEPGRGAQYIRAAGMGKESTHIPDPGYLISLSSNPYRQTQGTRE